MTKIKICFQDRELSFDTEDVDYFCKTLEDGNNKNELMYIDSPSNKTIINIKNIDYVVIEHKKPEDIEAGDDGKQS